MTVGDPLLWHASGTPHVTGPPPCKGADCNRACAGETLWCTVSEICPWSPVIPHESPCERARGGHKPRSELTTSA
jgi:hypothetical protein